MKRMIIRTLAAAALLTTTAHVLATPNGHEATQDGKGKYAEVNGLKMYYEIHGSGKPLVLLHGAFGWATTYPTLAKNRQVIAIELQGHGHTADIDRPLTYEQMADDTAALLITVYRIREKIQPQICTDHHRSEQRINKLVSGSSNLIWWYLCRSVKICG